MEGWRQAGLQPPVTCSFDSCSLSSVNRELVRKASQKDRLVVHSNMERDVGLLRLYPGIPASLVRKLRPAARCALYAPQGYRLPPSVSLRPFSGHGLQNLSAYPFGHLSFSAGLSSSWADI